MKSFFLITTVLLLSTNAFSKKPAIVEKKPAIINKKRIPAENTGKIIMTPAEEGLETEDFNNDDYSIQEQPSSYNNETVNKKIREKILIKSGVSKFTSQWDHLEKDIFILRAKNYNFEQFRSFYPQIPEQNLQTAYGHIRNSK